MAPGVFETPMMAGASEEVQAALAATIPFPKRLGRPAEFGKLGLGLGVGLGLGLGFG